MYNTFDTIFAEFSRINLVFFTFVREILTNLYFQLSKVPITEIIWDRKMVILLKIGGIF